MKRRSYLAATAVGVVSPLVGCLDDASDGDDADGGTDTTDPDDGSGLEIVGVDADPAPDLPVDPTVETGTAAATPDAPASVRVTWENAGSEPVALGEARSVVFATAVSDDGAAHLVDTDRIGAPDELVAFGDCWHLTDDVVVDAAYYTEELDPGERHEGESDLYADGDCLDRGTYRFETSVSVGDPAESAADGESADWGFDLSVERRS